MEKKILTKIIIILFILVIMLISFIYFRKDSSNTETLENDEVFLNGVDNINSNTINITISNSINNKSNNFISNYNTTMQYVNNDIKNATTGSLSADTSRVRKYMNNSKDNVEIKILKDTITPSGLTIKIIDNNEEPYDFGSDFYIQIKCDDEWKDVETIKEPYFFDIYIHNDNNEYSIDWKEFYGNLFSGTYRIVKKVFIYDATEDGYGAYENFYSDEFEIK